jgi:hypothetical protein
MAFVTYLKLIFQDLLEGSEFCHRNLGQVTHPQDSVCGYEYKEDFKM